MQIIHVQVEELVNTNNTLALVTIVAELRFSTDLFQQTIVRQIVQPNRVCMLLGWHQIGFSVLVLDHQKSVVQHDSIAPTSMYVMQMQIQFVTGVELSSTQKTFGMT